MSGQRGYTLIEVMLFLAVSGGLLSIAFVGFRGKQATTQFSQAMQDIQSSIQDTLNDTQSGFFPNPDNTACDIDAMSHRPTVRQDATTIGKHLSESSDCVFLGKVIGFGDGPTHPDTFRVYTVVGKKGATDTVAGSTPTIAQPLTEVKQTLYGAQLLQRSNVMAGPITTKVYTNILGSINGLDDSRQLPVLFTGKDFQLDRTAQETYIEVNTNYNGPVLNGRLAIGDASLYTPTILCFQRQDGGQTAQLTVGLGAGQGLTVRLDFRDCEGAP